MVMFLMLLKSSNGIIIKLLVSWKETPSFISRINPCSPHATKKRSIDHTINPDIISTNFVDLGYFLRALNMKQTNSNSNRDVGLDEKQW